MQNYSQTNVVILACLLCIKQNMKYFLNFSNHFYTEKKIEPQSNSHNTSNIEVKNTNTISVLHQRENNYCNKIKMSCFCL